LLLIQATTNELGKQMVLFAFLITEAFDSLALVTGKLVGKTPLVPAISPNKTWEGLAGGVAITLVLVAGVALYLQIDISKAAVTATVAIICAIVGDLTGSGMKRRAGVKDFPVVHERQGGLLDIFDAWIVAGAVLGGFSIFLAAT
jgi:phosphatidate cytidylyltransferase